jgi:hypothetical protein
VLPDVHADEGCLPVRERVVLVWRRDHGETGAVMDEPGPAGAELGHPGVLHLRLQLVEGTERVVYRSGQIAIGRAAAVGRHRLPEEVVVEVAAAVVADRRALVLGDLREVRDDLLDRLVGPVGALERGVHLVHVSLVVLVVMNPHRGFVDVRLEPRVVVGKRRYLVRHVSLLFRIPLAG